jgi:putative membrane protein
MMDGWDGMGAAGWVLMIAVWVVFVAAIVWAAASLFGNRTRVPASPTEAPLPEDILDQRLARGEIDVATYEELRAHLSAARRERG